MSEYPFRQKKAFKVIDSGNEEHFILGAHIGEALLVAAEYLEPKKVRSISDSHSVVERKELK